MTVIRRGKVPVDGDRKRVYLDTDERTMGLSVSEINEYRDTPEKDERIAGWRDHFDGTKHYKRPHWKEQGLYKRKRGTLGHYVILSQLGDVPKSDEERDAERVLKNWSDERPAITDDDVPDPNDSHAYEGEQPWSKCMRDVNWAVSAFENVADEYNIYPKTTISTEEYVLHTGTSCVNICPTYGGQFDLLYSADDKPTTLADLKFSSGIRYGNKLQLAAYRHAIQSLDGYPDTIDRVQVIRLYPDDQEIECISKYDDGHTETFVGDTLDENDDDITEWNQSLDHLTEQFLDVAREANDDWLTQLTIKEVLESITE